MQNIDDPNNVIAKLQLPKEGEAPELKRLGSLIAMCPVFTPRGQLAPLPLEVWDSIEKFELANTPIILVQPQHLGLTRHLYDAVRLLGPDTTCDADIGTSHRLRSMICYMPSYKHYVCFCARRSRPGHWLLFNDLPGLERRKRKKEPFEYESWDSVANACSGFGFVPSVLCYESEACLSSKTKRDIGWGRSLPSATSPGGGGGGK